MKDTLHIYSWNDMAQFGLNVLTSEACAYSMRLLCDVNEDGKALLADYLGMPDIHLADPWNSQVNGQPTVGSVMLAREMLLPLARFVLFKHGALALVEQEDGSVLGLFSTDRLDRYLELGFNVLRNYSGAQPHQGSRNTHQFTGRTM